eukprot:9502976-Pyramimonas_sp.AAC.1
MAVFVIMAVSTYLRPGALLTVQGSDLIPPAQGVTPHWAVLVHPQERLGRSKTGESDVSILLDSVWTMELNPLWERLRAVAGGGALWDFDYG